MNYLYKFGNNQKPFLSGSGLCYQSGDYYGYYPGAPKGCSPNGYNISSKTGCVSFGGARKVNSRKTKPKTKTSTRKTKSKKTKSKKTMYKHGDHYHTLKRTLNACKKLKKKTMKKKVVMRKKPKSKISKRKTVKRKTTVRKKPKMRVVVKRKTKKKRL